MISASTASFGQHAQAAMNFMRRRGALPLLVLFAVGMLAVPLPPLAIDCAIAFNLLVGVFLLSATIDGESVLALRAFPSLLLVSTIFRLGVNVSTTRSILSSADAGRIVRSFGDFVVGGQLAVGFIVFLVISIVQFLVVAKGGERIAEVSARFTLDALPGKQMSIDLDLKSGDITKEQARARRKQLEQESQFFGSMDGAMRFVKGDTIAGLLIVFVNLIGGLLVGVFHRGMSAADAAHTFSILSIGDGLAAQIPSILSTIAAGILTTRISEEESKGGLSADVLGVLRRERRSLAFGALALTGLGLVPGFPHTTLLTFAGLVGGLLFLTRRATAIEVEAGADSVEKVATPLPKAAYNEPFAAHVDADLARLLTERNFAATLAQETQRAANEIGMALNIVRFRIGSDGDPGRLVLRSEGRRLESFAIEVEKLDDLARRIVAHVARSMPETLVIDDVETWLDQQAKVAPKLVESIREQMPVLTMTHVVRRLLSEGIRLDHPRPMFMTLVQSVSTRFGVEDLLVDARLGLAEQIAARFSNANGKLVDMTFDDASRAFLSSILSEASTLVEFDQRESGFELMAKEIAAAIAAHAAEETLIVLVVDDRIRADLRKRLVEHGVDVPVLSHAEASRARQRRSLGTITLTIRETSVGRTPHDIERSFADSEFPDLDWIGDERRPFQRPVPRPRIPRGPDAGHRHEHDLPRAILDADRHRRPGRFQ